MSKTFQNLTKHLETNMSVNKNYRNEYFGTLYFVFEDNLILNNIFQTITKYLQFLIEFLISLNQRYPNFFNPHQLLYFSRNMLAAFNNQ